jgi:thiamine biosynthesis protein ThiS
MSSCVTANGKPYEIQPGIPLNAFLERMKLDASWVVVELNGEPLPRALIGGIRLHCGDRLEIVRAVPGG